MVNYRPIEGKDAASFVNLVEANKDRIHDYFPQTVANAASIDMAEKAIHNYIRQATLNEFFVFVMELEERLIGVLFIKSIDWKVRKAELAYFVDKDFEGNGYISSGIGFLTQFAFKELDLYKLYCRVDPENTGSCRVAEKNGFIKEGLLRKEFRKTSGEIIDLAYYGLLR